ncbi:helix-turn-helix domain-containing protein [Clostridium nigeriense]|uniref:helix-turn-helix domain-containing protein n=1 Tax=Clostridium nigeriense TaxID=1805470 RepID=UPI000835FE48|nr:helix-turn-helix domain-containing protein [Clostridium nigeriense]
MKIESKEIERDSNELLTKNEAQQILKVGHNTMLELLKTREFSFKIGNKWFCNKNLMLEWMDRQVLCK